MTIILFASCGQGNYKGSDSLSAVLPVDTLMTDSYVLTFANADSFATTDIYGDLNYRIQLTDTIGNWHNRAAKIQSYLSRRFCDNFFTTDTTLVLKLSNNKTLTFPIWDDKKDEGYNFEHYFEIIDYYLLRVQFGEGNCWMLVNRKNGVQKYINGLPYISKDGKKIISINSDLEAGYSFNGLELYSVNSDSLQTEFIKETTWGPTDVKWMNENQFILKREHFHVDSLTNHQVNFTDYKFVTIEKNTMR